MSKPIAVSVDQLLKNRQLIGGKAVSADQNGGIPAIEYLPNDAMINPVGVVFGGFLAAMMDDIMGMVTWLESERPFTTAQMSIAFLAAARADEMIVATANLVHKGRSQAFVEAQLARKSDSTIIAKASALQMFFTDKSTSKD